MENIYKFVAILSSDPLLKSLNVLSVHKDIVIPSHISQGSANLIAWISEVLDKYPEAFSIALLHKSAFHLPLANQLEKELIPESLKVISENDIYLRYLQQGTGGLADIQITRIRPATLLHVKKYMAGEWKQIRETKEIYEKIVLPFIESIPASRTAWIDKVMSKEAESSLILYHDADPKTGFMLLPDSKWDGVQKSQLYLLAISQSKDLKSVRDLDESHLPFLKSMRTNIIGTLQDKYGLGWSDVRMLVHYQPSYYWFHVHVINISIQGIPGTVVGQCHLLDDIIDHLENYGKYYKEKTLTYALSSLHPLFDPMTNAHE